MLSEFYCIFIFVVPVIVFMLSFSKIMDARFKHENEMHSTVYSFFMDDKCIPGSKCSDSELSVKGLDTVKVRKPSKGLKNDDKGVIKNGPLDEFYKEFETKIKAASGK